MSFRMSFQKKLFASLSIIIALLIMILSYAFYRYSAAITTDTESKTSQQIIEKISGQIDELYHQMDIAATSIVYNEEVQNTLFDLNYNTKIDNMTLLNYDTKIRKNLQSINFYLRKVIKTAVFNSDKNIYFYTGLVDDDSITVAKRLSDPLWYENLVSPKEEMRMVPPHQNEWSSTPKPVLSLFRKIKNTYGIQFGMFEIQMPYSMLKDICSMDTLSDESSILIFDSKGSLVYPYEIQDYKFINIKPLDIFKATKISSSGSTQLNIKNENILCSFKKSSYTNFTIVLASKQSVLQKQLSFYWNLTVIFSILIILTILAAFYILISRLTKPLKVLISTVNDVNLENMSLHIPNEEHNEFLMLNESFSSMFSKLKDSINKIYESKIRETDAHFMALQAQMNPHFLYNTLTVISASSEAQGNLSTALMCNQLSDMMRYIVSASNPIVTVKEEITHTQNYLHLMKQQYENYLDIEIDIPEEMYDLFIPKLTLQPLVENSINHGFENIQPPWNLSIIGRVYPNSDWEIVIKDNGSGFNDMILKRLLNQLQEYKTNIEQCNFKENLSIGGMGVLNTYSRFSIYFKENTVFNIENQSQGCSITLGYKKTNGGI